MVEKLIDKLDKLENQTKETLINLVKALEFCTERYDDIFGYPWGGILLWSIVWLTVCLMVQGVANGF